MDGFTRFAASALVLVLTVVPMSAADSSDAVIIQGFPAGNALTVKEKGFDPDHPDLAAAGLDSAWVVKWTVTEPGTSSSVLRIDWAKFYWKGRDDQTRGLLVLWNLQLAEIFVPYDGFPDEHDIYGKSFPLIDALPNYLSTAGGSILSNKVLKEVRPDGIRWMNMKNRIRHGEKLTLWSILEADNYRNFIEYNFRDDGEIHCRVGATGRNLKTLDMQKADVHIHLACWRFEPVLKELTGARSGGATKNELFLVRRSRKPGINTNPFRILADPFAPVGNGIVAREGRVRWRPFEFTRLRVQSGEVKNLHDRNTAYDLIPLRLGAVRRFPDDPETGYDERVANFDYWATRAEGSQDNYFDLPCYIRERRPLDGHVMTVWHCAPFLHEPRTEDFGGDHGNQELDGAVLTAWAAFTLKPRDLFDGTPFFTDRGPD